MQRRTHALSGRSRMPKSKPFFREVADPDKAFPGIKSLSITIRQDPTGLYSDDGQPSIRTYTKLDLPRRENCINPRCQQGGLDLWRAVSVYGAGEFNLNCNGNEGDAQRRRASPPCKNSFAISLEIERE